MSLCFHKSTHWLIGPCLFDQLCADSCTPQLQQSQTLKMPLLISIWASSESQVFIEEPGTRADAAVWNESQVLGHIRCNKPISGTNTEPNQTQPTWTLNKGGGTFSIHVRWHFPVLQLLLFLRLSDQTAITRSRFISETMQAQSLLG